MNKIVIVGCGGSGKSTLARQLGAILGIEVFYLDALFWQANWVRVPEPEQNRILADILKNDRWIIEGNHPTTQHPRFAAADTIIFLDMPMAICLWRVVKRTISRGASRIGVAEGCPDRLNGVMLRWITRFRFVHRPKLIANIEAYSEGRTVYTFTQSQQVTEFLKSLQCK
jgi:adenylate kinase family enzyme